MKTRCAGCAAVLAAALAMAHAQTRGDDALDAFLATASPAEAASKIDGVSRSGVSFKDAYRRLREGRRYRPQPGGVVRETIRVGGVEHQYAVNVPSSYDPSRAYRARFQLHGGVMMRHSNAPPPTAGPIGALAGDEDQFYILPFAWDASPWWTSEELLALRATLDAVKRRYNIDENRVVMSGVSDGGTGAYYTAMRDTTPYASFLPLNGYWGVLANRDLQIDVPLFPNNLRNKPLFIVNGERDPLYPTSIVDPSVEHYRKIGITLEYRPQAGAGHNTQWWPRVKDGFEAFARAHPREPLPDTLTWETASASPFNRAHWLVIDELGSSAGDAALDDPNLIESPERLDFGVLGAGNRISRVVPGSSAERFGLRAGDALVRVNGETVHVAIGVEEALEGIPPGSRLTLVVARNNAPLELEGVFDPKPVRDPPHPFFARGEPSGRIDLVRDGNTVTAKTRGVKSFTLLLSPERFDFAKPVKVVVNGRARFEGRVAESLRTLLKWAAADNDRTMLFGAELSVKID